MVQHPEGAEQQPLREQKTLGQLIAEQAQRQGDRTFLHFRDQEYSFREIDLRSNRVANGLRALGVEKGNTVALMLPNSPAFLYTFFGLAKLGAIEVPVNNGLRGNSLLHVLNHSDAKIIIVARLLVERIQELEDQLVHKPQIVIYEDG